MEIIEIKLASVTIFKPVLIGLRILINWKLLEHSLSFTLSKNEFNILKIWEKVV